MDDLYLDEEFMQELFESDFQLFMTSEPEDFYS